MLPERKSIGGVHHGRISALRTDDLPHLVESASIFYSALGSSSCLRHGSLDPSRPQHFPCKLEAQLPEVVGSFPVEDLESLRGFERVPYRVANRAVHIGQQRGDPLPGQVSDAH
jgi:hypothetical protein